MRRIPFKNAIVFAISLLMLAQPVLAAETAVPIRVNTVAVDEALEEAAEDKTAGTEAEESYGTEQETQEEVEVSGTDTGSTDKAEQHDQPEQSAEGEPAESAETAASADEMKDLSAMDQVQEAAEAGDTNSDVTDSGAIGYTGQEADSLSTTAVTTEEVTEEALDELQASEKDILNITWYIQSEGLYFTWNAVGDSYKIEIFVNGKKQFTIDQAANDYFFDDIVWSNGDRIAIKVTAYNAYNDSVMDVRKTPDILYCAQPTGFNVTNGFKGITFDWNSVKGAEGYRIYYCPKGGSWKKLKDVKGTSYTWTGAKMNQRYSFSVGCIDSSGKSSSYASFSKAITYRVSPEFSSIVGDKGTITMKWNKIDGVKKYRVYYCPKGGSWKRLTETSGNSALLNNPVQGKRYYFTVRGLDQNGTLMDALPAVSYLYTKAPKIDSSKNYLGYMRFTWTAVKGASSYVAYLRKEGGNWQRYSIYRQNAAKIFNLEDNCKYYFTVRAVTDDGKFIMSPSSNCKSFTYHIEGEIKGSFKDCSSAFTQLNRFRTGKGVWVWNSDNKTRTYYNTKASNTLSKLKWSKKLEQAAKTRAKELTIRFDGFHLRPNFAPFYTAAPAGTSYISECTARNSKDVTETMKAFFEENDEYDGQVHRRSLLEKDINAVGIACFAYEGKKYWVISLGVE